MPSLLDTRPLITSLATAMLLVALAALAGTAIATPKESRLASPAAAVVVHKLPTVEVVGKRLPR